MTENKQIVNEPSLYVNNLNPAWASNTTLTVAAGTCRDDGNDIDLELAASTTINGAVNGLNGLDTGSLANTTWYYIYVIGDSLKVNTTGCLVSTSATAPTMPAGYDVKRLIGYTITDGSAHFLKFYVEGNGKERIYVWDTKPSVVAAGSAVTYTAVDLSAGVPPLAQAIVGLKIALTPQAGGNLINVRPTGSAATDVAGLSASTTGVVKTGQLRAISALSSGVSKIDYVVSHASDSVDVKIDYFHYYI